MRILEQKSMRLFIILLCKAMSMKPIYMCLFISFNLFCQNNSIDSNGLRQGLWELYFPYSTDSIVSERGHFINSVEDGLWCKYYDNRMIREITYYNEGVLHGESFFFDKRGRVKSQEIFLNKRMHL